MPCESKLYLEFKPIKNNCMIISNNYLKCSILVSYESIVAIYDNNNNIIIINESYYKYSKTTSKHINMFADNFNTDNKIVIDNKTFESIVNSAFINQSLSFESKVSKVI